MNIGNVIKKYRMIQKMTQEELAEKLAITPQAVSRWENDQSYPDIAMVPKIVEVLKVPADELFDTGKFLQSEGEPVATIPLNVLQRNWEYREEDEEFLNQDQVDCLFGDLEKADGVPKLILAVDDAAFMRNMVSDILGSKGHRVVQAESGEAGLEDLKHRAESGNQVDMCLLDIRMPGMNGMDVLKHIRELYPSVQVVMLSAASTKENVLRAKELGAAAFIVKPFQPSRLLENV